MADDDSERIPTGIEGLDRIVLGGFPAGQIYQVEGAAGVGKTTLGLQFLLEGVRRRQTSVYATLSESPGEIERFAQGHGWSLEGIEIRDLRPETAADPEGNYSFFHPDEIELNRTIGKLLQWIESSRPCRLVIDSMSELQLVAGDSLRYRRQILALKRQLEGAGCTALLLDSKTADTTWHSGAETMVHGVIRLAHLAPEYGGERRRLRVEKLRGSSFIGGFHDFRIARGGIVVYPRLVNPAPVDSTGIPSPHAVYKSGLAEVDAMLGGGLDAGTATMIVGPSGVGKSTLAVHIVMCTVVKAARAAIYLFDESRDNFLLRARRLGWDAPAHLKRGELIIREMNPAEVSPGEFSEMIRNAVEHEGVSVVLIDSVNGYREAMPEERFLTLHLHDLLAYLGRRRVLTMIVATQHGFIGGDTPLEMSFLADVVILLRFFEAAGEVRKALSVLKKRTGSHETTIREVLVTGEGVRVGETLKEFSGVLSGALIYAGGAGPLPEGNE